MNLKLSFSFFPLADNFPPISTFYLHGTDVFRELSVERGIITHFTDEIIEAQR